MRDKFAFCNAQAAIQPANFASIGFVLYSWKQCIVFVGLRSFNARQEGINCEVVQVEFGDSEQFDEDRAIPSD